VNPAGHLVVRPDMDAAREIDLFDVIQGLKETRLTTPWWCVSPTSSRIGSNTCTAPSRRRSPRTTTEQIHRVFPEQGEPAAPGRSKRSIRYGQPFGFGLEVGSKPELLSGHDDDAIHPNASSSAMASRTTVISKR